MKTEEFTERQIIIGLLTSDEYLTRMQPIWKEDLIESPELKKIAGWCWTHFEQYKHAPKRAISSIYMEQLKHDKLGKAEAELIEVVLERISDIVDDSDDLNVDYLYDQTIKCFRERVLLEHRDKFDELIDGGNLDEAENLMADFKPFALADDKWLDSYEMEPIQWLWKNRIALGKATVITGRPEVGKSTLLFDFIARVTTGGMAPDGTRIRKGAFLIASTEDDYETTIVPRLTAAGADLSLCKEIGAESFNIDALCKEIAGELRQIKMQGKRVRGIMIDPTDAFLKGVENYNSAAVRSAFRPLIKLIGEQRIALILIHHNRKSGGSGPAMDMVAGSLAFVALARAAYMIVEDPNDDGRCLMLHLKNNLAPKQPGLAYRKIDAEVEEAKPYGKIKINTYRIEWLNGAVNISAEDAVAASHQSKAGRVDKAKDWLSDKLSDGPIPSDVIFEAAHEAGFTNGTLRRAQKELNIKARKQGFDKGWMWSLPRED